MALLRQHRDPARLFLRRVALLTLLFVVVFAASGVWGVYKKERGSATLRTQAENERADLLTREARLKEGIDTLKTDRGMEEALRDQYALAERGEGLIVIVDPPTPEPVQATSSSVIKWFQRIFPWW